MKVNIDLDKLLEKGEIEESDIDDVLEDSYYLTEMSLLPSFSFNKGQKPKAKEGQKFTIKIRDKYYKFNIYEGDPCEITWAHSIYYTNVSELKEIKL